jgi:uncharacterized protein YijF (DUF1287 family)
VAILAQNLVAAVIERTHHVVRYDSAYVCIPYPNGDVPAGTGVCADEVTRAYRAVGVDLQKKSTKTWSTTFGLSAKVAMVAIRHGTQHRPPPRTQLDGQSTSLPVTAIAADYGPGDLVSWDLGSSVPHIGIVVDQKSPETGRYLVVHNIGRGPLMEDITPEPSPGECPSLQKRRDGPGYPARPARTSI